MKRILLSVALLTTGACISQDLMEATAQVCDVNKPCLYQGKAYLKGTSSSIDIKVYLDKGNYNSYAAEIEGGKAYAFVLQDDNGWYVNYKGNKYYFNM